MDFKRTEEQELLLESLRTVMERGDFEDYFKECDEKHVFPQKAADALVEAGFASLGIPEEYDGTPVDILTQVMVAEEAHALGYPSLCWINFSTEVDDILTFGNPEQQKAVLEYAVQGKKPFTLGFTEPQAGSDSAAMATTATKRDGKVYINGTKTFNTSADKAPYMLCVARSGINESPYKDFSMYLFPMDRPGITTSKLSKIGNNMCGTYEVYLQDVECDESDLVGEECQGLLPAHEELRGRAPHHLRGKRGHGPLRLRGGPALRRPKGTVRATDRVVPAHPGEAGRHEDQDREHAEHALQGRLEKG